MNITPRKRELGREPSRKLSAKKLPGSIGAYSAADYAAMEPGPPHQRLSSEPICPRSDHL